MTQLDFNHAPQNVSLTESHKTTFLTENEYGEKDYQKGVRYEEGQGVDKDLHIAVQYYLSAAKQGHPIAQGKMAVCYAEGKGVEQNYEESIHWARLGAQQGDARAQNCLGVSYANGEGGLDVDYIKAVKLYHLAASQGFDVAQRNLGNCYHNGWGVPQDYTEAIKWYRLAAEQGDSGAQLDLGNCYYNGQGVSQDHTEAIKWYKLAAEQGNSDAQLNLGNCYYDGQGVSQDYTEAFKWYKPAAEQGNSDAQLNLGYCYDNGQGVSQDHTEAIKWYRLAAEQGNSGAQFNLGNCYNNGQGVSQDYTEAFKWYKLAAEQGNSDAQLNLGYCYNNGQGVSQDHTEAIKWYRLAAEQGNSGAQFNLGNCCVEGQGVSQDYTEAFKWYKLASEQGNSDAQLNLGYCYDKGRGVSQDYTEAIKWYKLAAEQGNSGAQFNLGLSFYQGQGVPRNYTEAVKWFKLAAEQGNSSAQFNLGNCYYNGWGVSQDYTEAIKWYKLAAEQGNSDAQFNLGNCYYDGQGVSQDYTEAIKWYKLAAEQGDSGAQFNLGICYDNGWGVSQDYTEAFKWYKLAAERGDSDAQLNLGNCYDKGRGVSQDYTEAIKWYRLAAKQGNSGAQFNLGICYDNGQGVSQDYTEAIKWYKLAAEQGNSGAQFNLGLSFYQGQGVPRNYTEAVKWFKLAAEQGSPSAQFYLGNCYKMGVGISIKSRDGENLSFDIRAKGAVMDLELQQLVNELNSLTGLEAVKNEVMSLIHIQEMNRLRKGCGLKTISSSNHLVFSGNPGTGKTTVARLLARIYHKLGVCKTDELVEVDRSGLVAGYIGQTATKVQEVIKKSLGGILFIDEAYTLHPKGSSNDFGQEAIDTLLKAMEDYRDNLIVIVAGYTDLMHDFINSNPGLSSRFNKYIHFDDYTPSEMVQIFCDMCRKNDYQIQEDALSTVTEIFKDKYAHRGSDFANGRDVRNFFEKIVANQSNRLCNVSHLSNQELCLLTMEDICPSSSSSKLLDAHNRIAAALDNSEFAPFEVDFSNAENKSEAASSDSELARLMQELNSLTGLEGVKKEVTSLIHQQRIKSIRQSRGLKTMPVSNHLVFSGNPGTGKTTVARLLAKIYYKMGICEKNELVEVDRSGLVVGYVGHTALKVQEVVSRALGGILFIDEAYTLYQKDASGDLGQEAIDTLLKAMEDYRDNLIVIVAGYTDLMHDFINSNPGLSSRFNKYIHFDDYTPSEMVQIFDRMCSINGFTASEDARKKLLRIFSEKCIKRDRNFANAREVRNLFENAYTSQASRLYGTSPSELEMKLLTAKDIDEK